MSKEAVALDESRKKKGYAVQIGIKLDMYKIPRTFRYIEVQFNAFHSEIPYYCALQYVIANFAPALAGFGRINMFCRFNTVSHDPINT